MDGVRRRTLDEKRFGVFECARVSDRQLMTRAPSNFQIPHSRWNDLPENELTECGYRIVTRAKGAGADMVVKQRNSLLVFFQGHLEYEAQTLLLEYRRDVGRYLRRERELYMRMPEVYFYPCATEASTAFQELALSDRREELLADFPTALVIKHVANTWHSTAVCVYANWLASLCAQKERRVRALNPK